MSQAHVGALDAAAAATTTDTYARYDKGLVSFLRQYRTAAQKVFSDDAAVEEALRVLEAANITTVNRLTDFFDAVNINCKDVTESYGYIVKELVEAASEGGISVGVRRSVGRYLHQIFLSINPISDSGKSIESNHGRGSSKKSAGTTAFAMKKVTVIDGKRVKVAVGGTGEETTQQKIDTSFRHEVWGLMDLYCNKGNQVLEDKDTALDIVDLVDAEEKEDDVVDDLNAAEKRIERYDTDPKNPQPTWKQVNKTDQYIPLKNALLTAFEEFWKGEGGDDAEKKTVKDLIWNGKICNWVKERRKEQRKAWTKLGIPVPEVILNRRDANGQVNRNHGKLKLADGTLCEPSVVLAASKQNAQQSELRELLRKVSLAKGAEGQEEEEDEEEDEDEEEEKESKKQAKRAGHEQTHARSKRGKTDYNPEEERIGTGTTQRGGGSGSGRNGSTRRR